MLHALLPAAALLTQNSAARVESREESAPNVMATQTMDSALPANASWKPITDGSTSP
jgi:hypothetical protein